MFIQGAVADRNNLFSIIGGKMGDGARAGVWLLLGGVVQEIFWWYNIHRKLSLKKYKNLIRSRGYWVTSTLLILLCALAIWLWKGENIGRYSPFDLILFGAAIPLFIKEGVGLLGKKDRNLGAYSSSSLNSYFLMGIRDK